MKSIFLAIGMACLGFFARFRGNDKMAGEIRQIPQDFYAFTIAGLEGGEVNMADYKGKYILCVNVASKCGFTPQYKDLQQLYTQYEGKLVVIGFPCNQFLNQEPGTAEEISDFCEKNYGVTFPLTTKIDVKGKDQHPIYTWLTTKELNGLENSSVAWNFHKYLIGPDGKLIAGFGSRVEPLSTEITSLIR